MFSDLKNTKPCNFPCQPTPGTTPGTELGEGFKGLGFGVYGVEGSGYIGFRVSGSGEWLSIPKRDPASLSELSLDIGKSFARAAGFAAK